MKKIMLVDDVASYGETLIERASFLDMDIIHFLSWEEARAQLLNNNEGFEGVILDGRGFLKKSDSKETGGLAITASEELKDWRRNGKYFPFVINTGFHETYRDLMGEETKVFEKGDEENMLKCLSEMIENSEEHRIILQHPDVFEAFGPGKLSADKKSELIEILKNINTNDRTVLVQSLARSRTFLEAIYWSLREQNEDWIPDACIKPSNQLNLSYCEIYLTNRELIIKDKRSGEKIYQLPEPIMPAHIGRMLSHISAVTSVTGNHENPEQVSNYALRSVVYSLLDFLLWYKSFALNNHFIKK